MRILITADIFPPDVGGPATYVPRIAAELTRRGHDVRVVTYSQTATHPEDGRFPFPVVRIPLTLPQWQRISRTLTTIIRHGRATDVIYANGLATETVLANGLLRKPLAAKVVGDWAWERSRDKGWIQDGIDTYQVRRYAPQVELMRWRRTWTYQHYHHIIVPSGYLRNMLLQCWKLTADRVSVVYNALDQTTEEAAPEPLSLTTRHKLVTVCRLTAWKGVDGLITLLPLLPDVGLVVVGDGPLRGQLEQQAQDLGVHERVLFTGNVAKERVAGFLKACDVFVLNSTYEGLPHVILEAMAVGLPVVATDSGGTGEVMRGYVHGAVVPAGDREALRAAVTRFLDHPTVGVPVLPEGFSFAHMVQETEGVLSRAMKELHR